MCYLKKFEEVSLIPSTKSWAVNDTDAYSSDQSFIVSKQQDPIFQFDEVQIFQKKSCQSQMFMNLISRLNYNSALMNSLDEKINKNNEALDQMTSQMALNAEKKCENIVIQTEIDENSENSQKSSHFSDQALTQKLFGKNNYRYKLKLEQNFPSIIYKQRNLSFTVSLIDENGNIVRNSNMIHLCLGVSDSLGNWITETKTGENFMKGKTQSQLYHGTTSFSKIYSRDVSRGYEGGKINFVVYPKPSTLNYSGNNSNLESKVVFEEIQPLVIKDLTVRAKKKNE